MTPTELLKAWLNEVEQATVLETGLATELLAEIEPYDPEWDDLGWGG